MPTVKQVFLDGTLLGGAQEVLDLIERNQLQYLVEQASQPALPIALQQAVNGALKANQV